MELKSFFSSFLYIALFSTNLIANEQPAGIYQGEYQLTLRAAPSGAILGNAINSVKWQWDFDSQTATFEGSTLSVGFNYAIHDLDNLDPDKELLYFDNNGDGSYTVHYALQIYNPALNNPMANASTTFKVSLLNGMLEITTLDVEQGEPDGIIGTQIPDVFPLVIEPDIRGYGIRQGLDSNGDGLSDQQALELGLKPDLFDSDGDTLNDVIELGSNFDQPTDSDQDGIIDALEYGVTADNPHIIDGLTLVSKDTISIQSNTDWRFKKITAKSMKMAIGNTDNNQQIVDSDLSLGDPGINYQFGFIDFELALASNIQNSDRVNLTLELSKSLPEKLLVYSIESSESGKTFTLIPNSHWTRINDNQLDITLYNHSRRDQSPADPNKISGSVAIAENTLGQINRDDSSGSIALMLSLLILLLLRRPNFINNKTLAMFNSH